MHDPAADDADADFAGVRQRVAKHYRYTCAYCGMKTLPQQSSQANGGMRPGHFQVHHKDDDHHNNSLDNLVLVCPFCHNVFHCGNAGKREAGSIIWAPWIKQEDLNLACHILFILMTFGPNDEETKKRGAEFAEKAEHISLEARNRYQQLQLLGSEVEKKLGKGLSNASVLGEALMIFASESPKLYEHRSKFLYGARFLPDFSYHADQVYYWRRANNNNQQTIHPDMLEAYWTQWQKMCTAE